MMAKAAPKYVVVHNGVAQWSQGDTLTDKDLKDHDVERLVDLGAIAPVNSDDAKAVQTTATAGVLPIQPDNPAPDTLRVDQPTLPSVGVTPPDSAPQEVKDATKDLTNAAS
jgi:hypothetical protein